MEEYIKKFGGVQRKDEVDALLAKEQSIVDVIIFGSYKQELIKHIEGYAYMMGGRYAAMSYGKQNRIKRGLVPKAKYMYRLWKVTKRVE